MSDDAIRALRELARKRGDQVSAGSDLPRLLAALDPTRILGPERRASLARMSGLLTRFEDTLHNKDK